jgi:hypothetical protein
MALVHKGNQMQSILAKIDFANAKLHCELQPDACARNLQLQTGSTVDTHPSVGFSFELKIDQKSHNNHIT